MTTEFEQIFDSTKESTKRKAKAKAKAEAKQKRADEKKWQDHQNESRKKWIEITIPLIKRMILDAVKAEKNSLAIYDMQVFWFSDEPYPTNRVLLHPDYLDPKKMQALLDEHFPKKLNPKWVVHNHSGYDVDYYGGHYDFDTYSIEFMWT